MCVPDVPARGTCVMECGLEKAAYKSSVRAVVELI